ncbi:MAG: tetratricopeptide repeat protein [Armatimonadota bacterium]
MRIAPLIIAVCLLLPALVRAEDPRALGDGIAFVARGQYAEAVQALGPLEAELGGDSVLQYWLGRAFYGLRNYRLAAGHLGQAAVHDGGNYDVCAWHARALRQAGAYPAALQAYADYTARFPNDDRLLVEYASTLALSGDLAGARALLGELIARRPGSDALRLIVDALATQERLEPPLTVQGKDFTLQYTPAERARHRVLVAVEDARRRVSEATDIEVRGFRVLLFADGDSYVRYARVLLPDARELHAVAFSAPGLLVMCSPDAWPAGKRDDATVGNILRHEMAHLAILQRGHGEGVPLWLNEGLACHFGGWGGQRQGSIPATPMDLRKLDGALLGRDTTPAYAQAHAMATVMAGRLGGEGLLNLLDLLANGVPLPKAYAELAGEPFEVFLREWPARYRQAGL